MHIDEVEKIIHLQDHFQNEENKSRFFFTENEKRYCSKRARCLGARFMIKKCVLDYLSEKKGYMGHEYRDIEIINDNRGQPMLRLHGDVHAYAKKMRINNIFISISHSKNWIGGLVVFSD